MNKLMHKYDINLITEEKRWDYYNSEYEWKQVARKKKLKIKYDSGKQVGIA
jgi:hypothetical protein